jgi:hypothetical protein
MRSEISALLALAVGLFLSESIYLPRAASQTA